MTVFQSAWNAQGSVAVQRRDVMLARIAALRALEARAAQASAKLKPVFILGGMGFMRGTKSERIYREVKVMMIGGGAEEIMKDLAARQLGL